MLNPFGRAKELESQVDQFLDLITKGTFCMREAIGSYLGGDDEDFQSRLEMVRDYERRADELKASTETMLYTHSLIPESRADVLELLEKLDDVIDRAKQIVQEFDVQQPDVEVGYFDLFVQLTDKSVRAVEQVVSAARAFFRNESQLRDFINKVDFYESEADRIGIELAAKAGYDPRAAVTLWEKMGALGNGGQPQFLSTHPHPVTRQAALAALVPQMLPLYEQAKR